MVETKIDLLLRKAVFFHDEEAQREVLELRENSEEKVDLSTFKVINDGQRTYYETLFEAIKSGAESFASALMTRNETLSIYFGHYICQNDWDAVNLLARIYLTKFPCQNQGVFELLMERALKQKDLSHAQTLFETIGGVDALTAELLRPMVEKKIPRGGIIQSPVLNIKLDVRCSVEAQP